MSDQSQFFSPEEVNNFNSNIVRVLDNGYINNPDNDLPVIQDRNPYLVGPEQQNLVRALGIKQQKSRRYQCDIPFDRQSFSEEDKKNNKDISTAFAGCFPKGISAGCAKHLECDQKKNCPLVGPLVDQQLSNAADTMPILRRCKYLGCVRPERAQKWLDDSYKQYEQKESQQQSIVVIDPKVDAQRRYQVVIHAEKKLDELCPHHSRVWQTEGGIAEQRKNPFRTLQCEISRPSSSHQYGKNKRLSKRRTSLDIPQGWYNRLGFSGVGIIVVANPDDTPNTQVFYLQLASSKNELRDYYEFPYFSMGRTDNDDGTKNSQQWRNEAGYPDGVLLQLLFRSLRERKLEGGESEEALPEVLSIFSDLRAEYLSDWEEYNKVLYCPAGEVATWLFMWSLLNEKANNDNMATKLEGEWDQLISNELAINDSDGKEKIKSALRQLLRFNESRHMSTELQHIGLLDEDNRHTLRANALLAWLDAVCSEKKRREDADYNNVSQENDFRFCCKSLVFDSPASPMNCLILAYRAEQVAVKAGDGIHIRNLADKFIRELSIIGAPFEQTLNSLQGDCRFPILPYVAWWRMSQSNYLLGHFVVPLGSGERFSGVSAYSDKDSRFLLAGIDESLWMEHGEQSVDYGSEGYYAMEKKLRGIIPITSRLVAPVSDATISYTFFQFETKKERAQAEFDAETQAKFSAHQMNTTLFVMGSKLDEMKQQYEEGYIEDDNAFDLMKKRMAFLNNENSVFLCHRTNMITQRVAEEIIPRTMKDIIGIIQVYLDEYNLLAALDRKLTFSFSEPQSLLFLSEKYLYPKPFVDSILHEIANNYGKYCKEDSRSYDKNVEVNMSVEGDLLTIEFSAQSIKTQTTGGLGYSVGMRAIKNIIQFISGNVFDIDAHFKGQDDGRFVSRLPLKMKDINDWTGKLIHQYE